MRKFLCTLCILCLLFTSSASAAGLFAGLVSTAQPKEELPDYGAITGIPADDMQVLPDGRIGCVYYNTTPKIFENFGAILGELGYEMTNSEYTDDCVYVTLEKGDLIFHVEYVWEINAMAVVYPADAVPESIGPVPTANPTPKLTPKPTAKPTAKPAVQENSSVCRSCSGLGDCMTCFGEGEFYCTGGCINGRCIACDDGQYLYDFDSKGNPKYRDCSYCTGGRCNKCGGNGVVDCYACTGGRCPTCGGNG